MLILNIDCSFVSKEPEITFHQANFFTKSRLFATIKQWLCCADACDCRWIAVRQHETRSHHPRQPAGSAQGHEGIETLRGVAPAAAGIRAAPSQRKLAPASALPESMPEFPGAQRISTTLDIGVLERSLLRRDQVWFVEKDRAQQSRLYPPAQGGALRPRLPARTLRGGAFRWRVAAMRLARTFPVRHGRRYPRDTLQESDEGSRA